jgi:transposase
VRFIDAFVATLDLHRLGFEKAVAATTGRPPYHPGDLLRLYLSGYLHRLRSSRLLEKECHRNVELIWLLRTLRPDFKTIADFRRDNQDALKKVCREFVFLCRKLNLFGGELSAIDGSKFKAVNSRDKNFHEARLQELIANIDAKIEKYLHDLDAGDDDEGPESGGKLSQEELEQKIAACASARTTTRNWPASSTASTNKSRRPTPTRGSCPRARARRFAPTCRARWTANTN